MSDNRKTLIEKLQKLRNDDSKNVNVKRTAGLALAALEMDKNATNLQGLIGTALDGFNSENGNNALSSDEVRKAVEKWLGKGIIEQGVFNNQGTKQEVNTNVLNKIALMITSCVEGKLSEDMCKKSLEDLPKDMEKQKVNLKLVLSTLKSLGFKIYNEDNVLVAGTRNQRVVQSVSEWKEDNKESLPTLAPGLEKVLETFVLTANAYGSQWNSEEPVPVKVSSRPVKEETSENPETIILGINSQVAGLTGFQKYYAGLLPIKAKNLGMLSLSGGAGLVGYDREKKEGVYYSYVDEQVDTNKNFVTADVLQNVFKQLKEQLEKKGVNLNADEMKRVETALEELKKEELNLINLTSIIEKYLALKKYFGVDDAVSGSSLDEMMEQMAKLLEDHKKHLTKVEKNRKGLGNVLLVMAQGVNVVV